MKELIIYITEEEGIRKKQVGRLWVENEKLMMQIIEPAFKAEIEKLIDWFSTQKLCSQIVGADFETLDFITVDGYCLPDDTEYLLVLKEAVNSYKGGQPLYAELVEKKNK